MPLVSLVLAFLGSAFSHQIRGSSISSDMFNGYSWQTRILEVRHDRMPLDPMFDNSYGASMPSSFHGPSIPNTSFSDNQLLVNGGLSASVSASALGNSTGSALGPSSPTQSSTSAAAFSIASHLNPNSISRSGSRMGMHSAGRSLFVGNVRMFISASSSLWFADDDAGLIRQSCHFNSYRSNVSGKT